MSSLSCGPRLCVNLYFYESVETLIRSDDCRLKKCNTQGRLFIVRGHLKQSLGICVCFTGHVLCAHICFREISNLIVGVGLLQQIKGVMFSTPQTLDSELSQGESLNKPYQVDPTACLNLGRRFERVPVMWD